MTREERLAILGADVIAHIREVVDAAPEPTPELVDELRRLLGPTSRTKRAAPTSAAA